MTISQRLVWAFLGAAGCNGALRLGDRTLRLEHAIRGPSAVNMTYLGVYRLGNCTVWKFSLGKIPLGSCRLGKSPFGKLPDILKKNC